MTRIGWGVDAHRFTEDGTVLLGGVVVDDSRGIAATSDGDVAAHALADALLGAAALGDLGQHFPAEESAGVDSMEILASVVAMVREAGLTVASADVTVIAQTVRVAPHREAIRAAFASALGVAVTAVSVKATTTDGMGVTGRDEGVAAVAVVAVDP